MANNATFALGPISPGVRLNGVAVTLGAIFDPPLSKLYVGGTGNLVLILAQTGTVTLSAVPAGTWVDGVAVISVGASSTATNIVGFF
jgi:DNA-binding beta-propeller fold protein YncE